MAKRSSGRATMLFPGLQAQTLCFVGGSGSPRSQATSMLFQKTEFSVLVVSLWLNSPVGLIMRGGCLRGGWSEGEPLSTIAASLERTLDRSTGPEGEKRCSPLHPDHPASGVWDCAVLDALKGVPEVCGKLADFTVVKDHRFP